MIAICKTCGSARNVRLRPGTKLREAVCGHCGTASYGRAAAVCPPEFRECSFYYGWGAEARSTGQERYINPDLSPKARDAWYAGFDNALRAVAA